MRSPPLRPHRRAPRLTIAAWYLYDFANSTYSAVIPATVYSVYYTTIVVGNETGRGDLWWGSVAVPIAMIAVAVTSPAMGAIADLSGARRTFFCAYTSLSVAAVALFTTVDPGDVLWGAALFVIATFGMEGAVVFYNAYLPELVEPDRIGRTSGWGLAVGYVGSIVGLAGALPFARAGRFDEVWLLVAALFGGFGLPALALLGRGGPRRMPIVEAAKHGWRNARELWREAWALREVRRFLIAHFLYFNGVNTAVVFSGPFATKTFGLTPAEVIVLFFLVMVSALVGAAALAVPIDRLGPKRVVQVSLAFWLAALGVFVFAEHRPTFWAACLVAGFGLGSIQAASRAFLATLVPAGRETELFGLHALCGKGAAPAGTVVFALVSAATGGNQRWAIASLGLFFVAGAWLVSRVRAGGPTGPPVTRRAGP